MCVHSYLCPFLDKWLLPIYIFLHLFFFHFIMYPGDYYLVACGDILCSLLYFYTTRKGKCAIVYSGSSLLE